MVILGSGFAPQVAQAQQPGSKRTDLQRHDLSAPGREVVQVRVDFDQGYVSPKHTRPGEEIIYVHWVTNVGSGNGAELATYVVEKGKPLITVIK